MVIHEALHQGNVAAHSVCKCVQWFRGVEHREALLQGAKRAVSPSDWDSNLVGIRHTFLTTR